VHVAGFYRIERVTIAYQSSVLITRIVAWSLATAVVVLSVIPPNLRPETSAPHNPEHFLIYASAGLAFALGYDRKFGLLAILLLIFAASTEIAQLFVPGRRARLSDFIIDVLAVCAGPIGVSLVRRIAIKSSWSTVGLRDPFASSSVGATLPTYSTNAAAAHERRRVGISSRDNTDEA
jgi:VanZ family protein